MEQQQSQQEHQESQEQQQQQQEGESQQHLLSENQITSCQHATTKEAEEQLVPLSQINKLIETAVAPYLEKIKQLELIQNEKDCQLTALFYALKKMDDILKKIETEQAKATTNGKVTSGTKVPARKTLTSSASANQLTGNVRSASARATTSSGQVSSSAMFGAKKTSMGSLTDSKRANTAVTRSALLEQPSNKSEKVLSARSSKTKKDSEHQPASNVKSTATKTAGEKAKVNSTKPTSKDNASTSIVKNIQTDASQVLNTFTSDLGQVVPTEQNLLQDINDDPAFNGTSVVGDSYIDKSEKDDNLQKSMLDASHQINDDSLLV